MKKLFKILLAFFAFCFITFAFIMPLNPPVGNWYQQFMPNIGGKVINDIVFLDSLTGFAVASRNVNTDTSSILRTTDGGDSWQVILTQGSRRFSRVMFINNDTGFVCGGTGAGTPYLYKTINGGMNWSVISSSGCAFWNDMHVLSNDTIWVVDSDGLCGGVFRTTNGGASWQNQLSIGSLNPNHIYMYNGRIGFIAEDNNYLRKTTDSGTSWNVISGADGFSDICFVDSLTGWKCFGDMEKTTNGGINWISQTVPFGGNIVVTGISKFSNVSRDTIWAIGGSLNVGGSPPTRGILYRTINGGDNWLFQVPDTSIHINRYFHIYFLNKSNGWAYHTTSSSGGIHTTNGGDTIWYTGIQQTSNSIPKDFALKQNYPNPFNPRTVIPYSIKRAAYVKLIAYDILGRENQKLVDQHQPAGEYEVDFMGKFASSGVYFYRIEVTDDNTKQLFTETKKMILLK